MMQDFNRSSSHLDMATNLSVSAGDQSSNPSSGGWERATGFHPSWSSLCRFGNLFWYKPTTRRLLNNFYGNLRGYRAPRKGEICSAHQTCKALPSSNFQLINFFFFCSARGLFSYFTVSCHEATTRFSSSSLCRRLRTPPPHAAVVASSSPSAAAARHR
jgi:hypothetical protein